MDKQVVARKEASEKGLNKYFTGMACCHGHVAERLTISGSCVECTKESVRRLRLSIKNNAKN